MVSDSTSSWFISASFCLTLARDSTSKSIFLHAKFCFKIVEIRIILSFYYIRSFCNTVFPSHRVIRGLSPSAIKMNGTTGSNFIARKWGREKVRAVFTIHPPFRSWNILGERMDHFTDENYCPWMSARTIRNSLLPQWNDSDCSNVNFRQLIASSLFLFPSPSSNERPLRSRESRQEWKSI